VTDTRPTRRLMAGPIVLGLALSGFFDGILLHQVLQWHHFLSLVPGATYDDLRTQVMADGLFHVAVYLLAACGLVLLWRARDTLQAAGSGGRVAGGVLLGFGIWNIADVGLFHWILGIHRIRVNVANPMAYDLAWFIGLGIVVAIAGLVLIRRSGGGAGGSRGGPHGGLVAIATVAALILAIPVANLPSTDGSTLILLRPGVIPAPTINAVLAADGSIVAIDPGGYFLVAQLPRSAGPLPLYRAGALLVTRSPAVAGCLAFMRRV
jgi:uncharacterized membrane protein